MPNIEPESIKYLSNYMKNLCDVATLASNFKDKNEINNINNVKVLTKEPLTNEKFCSAIDFFSRTMIIMLKIFTTILEFMPLLKKLY